MRIKRLTLSIVMLAVISPDLYFVRSLGQSVAKPIKVEKVWGGEIKLELRQQAPKTGFIADGEAWAKLWRAYRRNERLPKIDFDKKIILVEAGRDPNYIGYDANKLIPNEKGDLKISFMHTLIGYLNPTTCRSYFC